MRGVHGSEACMGVLAIKGYRENSLSMLVQILHEVSCSLSCPEHRNTFRLAQESCAIGMDVMMHSLCTLFLYLLFTVLHCMQDSTILVCV